MYWFRIKTRINGIYIAKDELEITEEPQKQTLTGFIRSKKSEKKVPFTQGSMVSQGKLGNLKVFCMKSQGKSGKKIPVENEVSRSTFGFQNCFHKKSYWVCLF